MNTTNTALPNYTRREVADLEEELGVVHDLLGGTKRMWERSAHYIRKWKAEDEDVYNLRRKGETLFEGLSRTLSASTGMLFAKAPTIAWNASETAMTAQWDNIDAGGTKGTVFTKRFAEASLRDGLGVILIDHPAPPKDANGVPIAMTAAVEQRYNLRPKWAKYGRRSVINWDEGLINNSTVPTMLMFAESGSAPVGSFGTRSVQRYREVRVVLTPSGHQATWRLWEQTDDIGDKLESFQLVDGGVFRNRDGVIAETLPVAIAYTGRTDGVMSASIPLMGVAWANLAYWQIATDLRFNRAVCGFEQMVVSGDLMPDPKTGETGKLKIGPLVAIHLAQGGTAEWKGPTGSGLAQLETGKLEKLSEMAQQGVSFMQKDTRAAETATAKQLDAAAENSTLATAAQGIEDAINTALEIHAWYLGIEKVGAPVLTISRNYESTTMPAPLLTAWVGTIANAGLPVRLLLNAMQAGGLIGADEDLDALEAEILVNQTAIAEQQVLNAAAHANNQNGNPNATDPNADPTMQAAA